MVFNLISTLMILLSLYTSWIEFKSDKSVIKNVYLKRKKDYLWAFLIALIGVGSIITLSTSDLPKFLTWSWLSIFDQGPTNMALQPFSWGSILITVLFWIILVLSLPYLAKMEEETFRSGKLTLVDRIKYSIFFGFAHIIMGVNLVAILVISITGFIYSTFYKSAYHKAMLEGDKDADKTALFASTSVHTKYNFILITFVAIISILTSLV